MLSKYQVGEDSDTEDNRFNSVLSNDTGVESLEIYPNPVRDLMNLNYQIQSDEALLVIYDLSGKVVFSRNLDADNTKAELNLAGLEKGFYLVRINDGSDVITKKIVKQ